MAKPVAKAPKQRLSVREEASATEPVPEEPGRRIAVIDDEPHIVRLVVVHLEQGGYEAVSAPDGVEGLALIARERPDLIVLDLMMPRMSGQGVLRELRRDAQTMALPVVILTAKRRTDPGVAICHELAQAYIEKPFHPGHVIRAIRGLLGYSPPIAAAVAKARAFRFGGEGDPMDLVTLYRDMDAHVKSEVFDALAERGDDAIDALAALRAPSSLMRLGTDAAREALRRLSSDPDPVIRLETIFAMREWNLLQGGAETAYFEDGCVVDMTRAGVKASDFTRAVEGALAAGHDGERSPNYILRLIASFGGTYVTEVLQQVARDDTHGLASLSEELLVGRDPRYPTDIVGGE